MKRIDFIKNIGLGAGTLFLPTWMISESLPQIKAIEHIRHGLLDFDMNHENVLNYKGTKIRIDQMYANGHSPNTFQDMYIVSTLKNGKFKQDIQIGPPRLEEYI